MHRILVEEKRWLSERRFLHALNYCMLLPGPEAQQLTVYVGWLLHGVRGGLVAGSLFVLPGVLAILALSVLYAGFRELAAVDALFFGLKAAVLAIVVEAVFRIGKRALRNRLMVALAAAAFAAIFLFKAPFPAIVLAAALLGALGEKAYPGSFVPGRRERTESDAGDAPPHIRDDTAARVRPTLGRALRVLAVCLTLWFAPFVAIVLGLGASHVFVEEGLFFSKVAVVTFGGAYAVLAYVAQQAVEVHGWLEPGEMLDGLGMAETTPGPLIQVMQFVGFMGAYRHPGGLDPVVAGVLASALVTWVTYVPCFLWVFLGAPSIERLREARWLNAALSGVTAAVVGVILNLAVWFAIHTVFAGAKEVRVPGVRLLVPEWRTVDLAALAIGAAAFVALFRFKLGMLKTLALSVALGAVWRAAAGW
jgi:chromate transporter